VFSKKKKNLMGIQETLLLKNALSFAIFVGVVYSVDGAHEK